MTKVLRRLFLGALLLLIASGVLSGVFVASGESPLQGAQVISVGALTQVSLGEVQTFSFTPSANAQYGVYLFPENEGAAARAEIRLDGETVAEGEGALCLFTCRLNAGTSGRTPRDSYIVSICIVFAPLVIQRVRRGRRAPARPRRGLHPAA